MRVKVILLDFSRVLLFHNDKNYNGSLNEFYRQQKQSDSYNVFEHYKLNTELLEYVNSIKNVACYILTSETIQNDPAFAKHLASFKKIYSAVEIGLSKKDPSIYEYVAKDIDVLPKEIVFVDDNQENIEAAKRAGLNTIWYQSNNQLLEILSSFFNHS